MESKDYLERTLGACKFHLFEIKVSIEPSEFLEGTSSPDEYSHEKDASSSDKYSHERDASFPQ